MQKLIQGHANQSGVADPLPSFFGGRGRSANDADHTPIAAHQNKPRPPHMASSSAANLLFFLVLCFLEGDGKGNISDEGDTSRHYFLYSVNPGEGFNLRRDVHMRAASLVQTLRQQQHSVDGAAAEDWVLVLPPWPHLYHWKSRNVQQTNVKWDAFFHLPSLNEFVPTIEFDEYVARKGMKFEEVCIILVYSHAWPHP